MERKPIEFPEGYEASPVYIADTYIFNRPNKDQRYLQPYYLDKGGVEVCYFPINSFGKREPKLGITRELMEKCVDKEVPMVLETRTAIPNWAVENLARSRGSLLIVQVPTLSATMRRRFFSSTGAPDELRELILNVFQTGTNVRLKFAPVIPSVTGLAALTSYMNSVRSFLEGVDIGFSRLDLEDIRRIENRNRLKPDSLKDLYDEVEGEYFLKDTVKERVMEEFRVFCQGNNIPIREY